MSIITGRGDQGDTDLLFGKRIAKTSIRVEALGGVDELNTAIGMARAASSNEAMVQLLDGVQERLVGLMGQLATLPIDCERYHKKGYALLTADDVTWITQQARDHESRGVRYTGWARPGAEGSQERAALDFARSVARRAERAILRLDEAEGEVPEEVKLFFNRASDLLWILARSERE